MLFIQIIYRLTLMDEYWMEVHTLKTTPVASAGRTLFTIGNNDEFSDTHQNRTGIFPINRMIRKQYLIPPLYFQ